MTLPNRQYAERRAQGLCAECEAPSPKYSRCLSCRIALRPLQRTYERKYDKSHKRERLAAQRIRDRRTRPPRIVEEWFLAAES